MRTVQSGWGVDTYEFRAAARALRVAMPELNREFKRELRAAADVVAKNATEIVSAYSSSIPPTIKVRTATAAAWVQAGGGEVAIAGLFELGNRQSRTRSRGAPESPARSGTFRHPVFGNRNVWVEQPMHPYLRPAGERAMPEVQARIVTLCDSIAERIRTETLEGGESA